MRNTLALLAILLAAPAAGAQGTILPRCGIGRPICPPPRPGASVERTASHVRVELRDRVLRYEVEERFVNRGGMIAEADYVFPLPKDAAFQDLKLSIDGELVAGETMSADKARAIYEEIVRRQRDPALVEWMSHGLLRARIFPIQPGEEKRVVVRFDAVARREGDALRVDYRRGTEPVGPPVRIMPVDDRRDIRSDDERETFTLVLPEGTGFGTPYSPTHSLARRERRGQVVVEASGSTRDVTILVPVRSAREGAVSLLANSDGRDDRYALITLSPPARRGRATPRDVTLVIDVSGSMSGKKLAQAKAAGRQVLATLAPQDRFRVIDFSTDVRVFREEPAAASRENIRAAGEYIDDLQAQGSTNISGALDEALASRAEDGRMAVVLFLTDGAPTVGETSPEAIASRAGRKRGPARVFTFGVGADVNAALMERLALEGRGTATFVRPEEDVERAVGMVAGQITDPLVTDLRVSARGVRLDRMQPSGPVDVFAGEDLVLLAHYSGEGRATLVFTGRTVDGPVEWREEVVFPERERDNAFVPRLWATQRIGWLSAEKRRAGGSREIDDEIRALGEKFAIPTEFTSYLVQEPQRTAVGNTSGRGVGGVASAPVAVAPQARAERDFDAAKAASERRQAKTLAAADAVQLSEVVVTSETRRVGNRVFTLRDSVWTDSRAAAGVGAARRIEVRPYSEAWFALSSAIPELADVFALGDRVIVVGRDVAIEVAERGRASLSDAEIATIRSKW